MIACFRGQPVCLNSRKPVHCRAVSFILSEYLGSPQIMVKKILFLCCFHKKTCSKNPRTYTGLGSLLRLLLLCPPAPLSVRKWNTPEADEDCGPAQP
jgi:hypothetical protein